MINQILNLFILTKEYKKAGDPTGGPSRVIFGVNYQPNNFIFLYSFASTDIRIETETWAFSTASLIADLGGSLSLFVGVSALSLWDGLEYLLEKYRNKFGK